MNSLSGGASIPNATPSTNYPDPAPGPHPRPRRAARGCGRHVSRPGAPATQARPPALRSPPRGPRAPTAAWPDRAPAAEHRHPGCLGPTGRSPNFLPRPHFPRQPPARGGAQGGGFEERETEFLELLGGAGGRGWGGAGGGATGGGGGQGSRTLEAAEGAGGRAAGGPFKVLPSLLLPSPQALPPSLRGQFC